MGPEIPYPLPLTPSPEPQKQAVRILLARFLALVFVQCKEIFLIFLLFPVELITVVIS